MTLEQALAVYAHFLHETPRDSRQEALFKAAREIIAKSALQVLAGNK